MGKRIVFVLTFFLVLCNVSLNAQDSPPALEVTKAAIALNIVDNNAENAGENFPSDVRRLYCFTQIRGANDSTEIEHRWYWGDDLMTTIPLKIRSSLWRTYSSKSIPSQLKGDWRVAVVDVSSDSVIKMLKFTIE